MASLAELSQILSPAGAAPENVRKVEREAEVELERKVEAGVEAEIEFKMESAVGDW